METILKPCPFCGGEAEHHDVNCIECAACGASIDNHGCMVPRLKTVDSWNTRTPTPREQELEATLAEEREKAKGLVEVLRAVRCRLQEQHIPLVDAALSNYNDNRKG
jgi:hypothetical protein